MNITLGLVIGALIALFIIKVMLKAAKRAVKMFSFFAIMIVVGLLWFNKELVLSFINSLF